MLPQHDIFLRFLHCFLLFVLYLKKVSVSYPGWFLKSSLLPITQMIPWVVQLRDWEKLTKLKLIKVY